jgi:hypothetical protein
VTDTIKVTVVNVISAKVEPIQSTVTVKSLTDQAGESTGVDHIWAVRPTSRP